METKIKAVNAAGLEVIVAPDTARAFLVRRNGGVIPAGELELTFESWHYANDGLELQSSETVTITIPGIAAQANQAVAGTLNPALGGGSTTAGGKSTPSKGDGDDNRTGG